MVLYILYFTDRKECLVLRCWLWVLWLPASENSLTASVWHGTLSSHVWVEYTNSVHFSRFFFYAPGPHAVRVEPCYPFLWFEKSYRTYTASNLKVEMTSLSTLNALLFCEILWRYSPIHKNRDPNPSGFNSCHLTSDHLRLGEIKQNTKTKSSDWGRREKDKQMRKEMTDNMGHNKIKE